MVYFDATQYLNMRNDGVMGSEGGGVFYFVRCKGPRLSSIHGRAGFSCMHGAVYMT